MTAAHWPCPFCGAQPLQTHHVEANDYITHDAFSVLVCMACGGGRTVPVPEDLGPYYPARYRRYYWAIAAAIRVLYRRRVARWVHGIARPGRAFELGCGDGSMLATLHGLGWRVLGCERTEAAAQFARDHSGIEVLAGGLDAVDPAARFDLILLIQALEHLDRPGEILARLVRMLATGGRLVICVPNFGGWQAWFGGTGWFHLDVPRHLSHFTPAAIAALAATNGLRVERVTFDSLEHDPYGWIQSALNRIDSKANRLTRLLMRLDPPDAPNLLHLAASCLLGLAAVPLTVLSWVARRGAVMEITCTRAEQGPSATS